MVSENYSQSSSKLSYNKNRLSVLAQPKLPESLSYVPNRYLNVRWGTQETLAPLTKATLNAEPTGRLTDLARPKKDFLNEELSSRNQFDYSCGRRSPIWEVSEGAKNYEITSRLLQLSEPKQPPPEFKENMVLFESSCGRSSPIGRINAAALNCEERPRTTALAQEKQPHPQFMYPGSEYSFISPLALKATASCRLENLAVPKQRVNRGFQSPFWKISNQTLQANPSQRVIQLARCKTVPDSYVYERSVQWPVSKAAKKASASQRVTMLSAPVTRQTMDDVQFNSDAFKVNVAALTSRCTHRVQTLAQPIDR